MSNDTPESNSQDSHVPFISNRNELDDEGVSSDMSDTPQDSSQESSQFTVDGSQLTVDAPLQDETSDSISAEGAESTGELDVVDALDDSLAPAPVPVVNTSPTEPITTVQFDYDDYYGVGATPTKPVPVSESIQQPPDNQSRGAIPFFLGALVAGILGAVVTLGVLAATGTFDETELPSTTIANAAEANVSEPQQPVVTNQIINEVGSAVNPTAVALKVVPSIVTITVFEDGTGGDEGLFGVGSGSGVVVSESGYILTNHHVIEGATDFRIEFDDGRVYTAELIGSDDLTDIAVLQISADEITPIDLGSSDALALGDPAIAVGNPLGQDGGPSVSAGIVSAFDRRVDFSTDDFLHGMIQTDAAINSGSSGGALVNSEGELIGITSAIGVSQAGPEGIGYAVPVELAMRIADEIIETGDVAHPFLGVTIGTFLDEAPDGATIPSGSDIQSIEGTASAAGDAGLQAGDIIVRIGDKEITGQTELILAVRLYRVGDEVEFVALRDGELETFTVVLGQRPSEFGG